jgi:hypothetical protein
MASISASSLRSSSSSTASSRSLRRARTKRAIKATVLPRQGGEGRASVWWACMTLCLHGIVTGGVLRFCRGVVGVLKLRRCIGGDLVLVCRGRCRPRGGLGHTAVGYRRAPTVGGPTAGRARVWRAGPHWAVPSAVASARGIPPWWRGAASAPAKGKRRPAATTGPPVHRGAASPASASAIGRAQVPRPGGGERRR